MDFGVHIVFGCISGMMVQEQGTSLLLRKSNSLKLSVGFGIQIASGHVLWAQSGMSRGLSKFSQEVYNGTIHNVYPSICNELPSPHSGQMASVRFILFRVVSSELSPISQSELISSGQSQCLISILGSIMSDSLRDVCLSSYIVHLMQQVLLSLISEENHCISVISYQLAPPEYLY